MWRMCVCVLRISFDGLRIGVRHHLMRKMQKIHAIIQPLMEIGFLANDLSPLNFSAIRENEFS